MADKTLLGRDAILRGDVLKRRPVHVEQLDGDILVREMTGLEAAQFQKKSLDVVNPNTGVVKSADALARLNASVAICGVIDEDGGQIFKSADAEALMELPASVLEQISDAVLDLSGMSVAGRRRAEKNSGRTLNGASGSA